MPRPKKPTYLTTSFSRLNTYQTCSWLYRRKYIDRVNIPTEFKEALVQGNFVHAVIEEVLDPNTLTTEIEDALYIHFESLVEAIQVDIEKTRLFDFAKSFGDLCWRATEQCQDPSLQIRTKTKTIPNDIQNYPPHSWTSALSKSGLSEERFKIDNLAADSNPVFLRISLSYFLGRIFGMLKGFEIPDWVDHTVFVEKGFSTDENNKLKMPGKDSLYFNGYLDWVVIDKDDNLIIVDHKTSKKKPTTQQVKNLPQLNLYAWGYKLVYGRWPDKIAIHHVRSGQYVVADVDIDTVRRTLLFYASIQIEGIDKQAFLKKHPEEYNSPCLRRDYKTNQVVECCPLLENCWPELYRTIQEDDGSSHTNPY